MEKVDQCKVQILARLCCERIIRGETKWKTW